MIEQVIDFNLESFLTPILDVFILIVLMILMMIMYARYRILPLILLITLISLIVGVISIQLQYNPFTPYFQAFFILFQTIFFLKSSTEYRKEYNRINKRGR